MDSLIAAAARALATGDPLGALKRVALRDDAPALALRGIAMAQLGDFSTANKLLRSAIEAFGSKQAVSRARCIVAKAEIALAARDLGVTTKALDIACATLESHGDHGNAMHARLRGQGAAYRARSNATVDDATNAENPDNIVTPWPSANCLDCPHLPQ